MSRIDDWTARPQQTQKVVEDLINDKVVTVQVTRAAETGTRVGFDSELVDNTYMDSINVRLDESKLPTEDFVALTDESDVRKNDRWKWQRPDGRSAFLKVVRVQWRDRGNEVGLKYE